MKYRVEIKKEPFEHLSQEADPYGFDSLGPECPAYECTAYLYSIEAPEDEPLLFGYQPVEEIYAKILSGESINLSYSYINDFSMGGYLEYCRLAGESEPQMVLSGFSAYKSYIEGIESNVLFRGVRFGDGKVDFRYARFGDGDVYFIGAQFEEGNVDFSGARFGDGNVYFSGARFGDGNVYFSEARFGDGNVYFSEARFGDGNVEFSMAQFGKGNVGFIGAQFGKGDVDFSKVEFGDGDVRFTGAEFGEGYVDFRGIKIHEGDIVFRATEASTVIFNSVKLFGNEEFNFKSVHDLLIVDCIIDGTLELGGGIDTLCLKGTTNLGQIIIDWDETNVKSMTYNQGDGTTHVEKAKDFVLLKENYHNMGRYEEEDKAYFEYKRCMRLSKPKPIRYITKIMFELNGGYGTKPGNIVVSIGVVWLLFAILYAMDFTRLIDPFIYKPWVWPWLQKIATGMYFSVITFVTVGYGDVQPGNHWTTLLTMVEGFLGVFLMSYFTVAVVRKLLR